MFQMFDIWQIYLKSPSAIQQFQEPGAMRPNLPKLPEVELYPLISMFGFPYLKEYTYKT